MLGVLLLPGLVAWAWRREPRSALVLLWPLAFWAMAGAAPDFKTGERDAKHERRDVVAPRKAVRR